jgi:hypothetical protein
MADLDSAAQVLAEPSRYSLTPIAGELSESFVTLAAWANGTATPSPRPAENTTARSAAIREIEILFSPNG